MRRKRAERRKIRALLYTLDCVFVLWASERDVKLRLQSNRSLVRSFGNTKQAKMETLGPILILFAQTCLCWEKRVLLSWFLIWFYLFFIYLAISFLFLGQARERSILCNTTWYYLSERLFHHFKRLWTRNNKRSLINELTGLVTGWVESLFCFKCISGCFVELSKPPPPPHESVREALELLDLVIILGEKPTGREESTELMSISNFFLFFNN